MTDFSRCCYFASSGYPSGCIGLSLLLQSGMEKEALSEMVGLTRKTVNGYFAEFEREGLIRRTYASTILLDPSGLQRVAES